MQVGINRKNDITKKDIMTEQETYSHGSSYEFFIRRAFNCDRGKHGAETAYLKYLLMSDLGKNFLSQPYEKQFTEVKGFIIKAIDKFLTRKPTEIEKTFLEQMKMSINKSNKATELVQLINDGLENTMRYRDLKK